MYSFNAILLLVQSVMKLLSNKIVKMNKRRKRSNHMGLNGTLNFYHSLKLQLIWLCLICPMLKTLSSALCHLQLSSLEVPSAWKKVDVLREAGATQGHLLDSLHQRQLMEEIFFLKRLQTIMDFFRLCASFAHTLSGESFSLQHKGL